MRHSPNLQALLAAVRGQHRNAADLAALGAILVNRAEFRRAAPILTAAAAQRPDDPAVLHHLASSLLGCGRAQEAAEKLALALRLDGGRLDSWEALGKIQMEDFQRPDSALASFGRAVELAPGELRNYTSAALCCLNGSVTAAIRRLGDSLPSNANLLHVRRGVAMALADTGRYEDAVAACQDLLADYPDDPTALYGLGKLQTGLHEMDAAGRNFERALRAAGPGCRNREILMGPMLHWARLGDWERARTQYRAHVRDVESHFGFERSAPIWEGQDASGKTILLIAGDIYFGDALQFVRFARTAKQAGARVVVQAPARIRSLLRTVPGIDMVVAPHDATPPYDYVASAFSLLFSCNRPVEEMLGRQPYVEADATLCTAWRERLGADGGFHVGIAWRGSWYAAKNSYACRSMPLELLRPLSHIPGVRLYSLQCGPACEELRSFPAADLAPDFANTAAAIRALHLVVTIDTSIAHLAGALGQYTYVMLPYDACFRWMMDRDDTPWYSGLRLFRQTRPGDWSGVVANVSAAVALLAVDRATA